jgi:CheY-like chemotaxis protein
LDENFKMWRTPERFQGSGVEMKGEENLQDLLIEKISGLPLQLADEKATLAEASRGLCSTEKRSSEKIQSGTETILLVDDEETISEVMEKALTLTGYKVLLARGGEEALEVFRNNRNRIDVVVLDMIMPGMNGDKVFDRLRQMDPGVSVILSTGDSKGGEVSHIMTRGCNGFLQKPFGIKELSQKIREVIDKKKAETVKNSSNI